MWDLDEDGVRGVRSRRLGAIHRSPYLATLLVAIAIAGCSSKDSEPRATAKGTEAVQAPSTSIGIEGPEQLGAETTPNAKGRSALGAESSVSADPDLEALRRACVQETRNSEDGTPFPGPKCKAYFDARPKSSARPAIAANPDAEPLDWSQAHAWWPYEPIFEDPDRSSPRLFAWTPDSEGHRGDPAKANAYLGVVYSGPNMNPDNSDGAGIIADGGMMMSAFAPSAKKIEPDASAVPIVAAGRSGKTWVVGHMRLILWETNGQWVAAINAGQNGVLEAQQLLGRVKEHAE